MTSNGVVAGATLPGDRLVGICRIPLASVSRGMPMLDGWYNVYDHGQVASGQLRVRIAPDLEIGVGSLLPADDDKDTTTAAAAERTTAESSTTAGSSTTSNLPGAVASTSSTLSTSLSVLRNVVRDLDQVQHRLRTINVGVVKKNKNNNSRTTNDASTTNDDNNDSSMRTSSSNSSLQSSFVPPHMRVTTAMSNSPSNWLAQRSSATGMGGGGGGGGGSSVYTRKRFVSGASE